MRFTPLALEGVVLVAMDSHRDARGHFARSFCEEEFAAAGLPERWPQMNVSVNAKAGTLRGMHFQRPPFEEPKVVRCVRGAILDVVIDLRPASATFRAHLAVPLDAESGDALYVPPGFAHGFQALIDDSEVLYMMGARFEPGAQDGVRWDDPAFGISWPLPVSAISPRDAAYSDFAG
ncbi:dTDP-4-dehydrorhamnose 3,5-epimerase family protein [Plastoroseomonas arctica]|uniref:dTDP-4-dehydrorhamnose 3,5-epimerase n=1 Tax=Plastoroseomonas arctica TaxID=1509237 RepID=A0AAF1JXD0_9PROT|nr:dTDP-4-dehydrorhamnose 3,5-epimerase family protein [Plastoroseomonas arctica]MBR0655592.1 dTDP-4-keto-6-deoxy-D-glucose epimerase [Plastoroseomonas arctica]